MPPTVIAPTITLQSVPLIALIAAPIRACLAAADVSVASLALEEVHIEESLRLRALGADVSASFG